jgi:hypothetical protein
MTFYRRFVGYGETTQSKRIFPSADPDGIGQTDATDRADGDQAACDQVACAGAVLGHAGGDSVRIKRPAI